MPQVTLDSLQTAAPTISVFYNGTDTLKKGQLVCYQRNYSGSGVTATDVSRRNYYVQKPNYTNRGWPAGWVNKLPRETGVAGEIEIIPVGGEATHEIEIWTDENITYGDVLGVCPGDYATGKWTCGHPLAIAIESQDRSTTSGTVKCVIGRFAIPDAATLSAKRIQWFDDFTGRFTAGATTALGVNDVTSYVTEGTTVTSIFADSLGPDQATAGKQAAGALRVTSTTTSTGQLRQNGEPYRIDVGKSVFFRCRFATEEVANNLALIGLSITDTDAQSTLPTDYIAFKVAEADLIFAYVKDGTTGLVSNTGMATLTADVFVDCAFIVRNRGAGGMTIRCWVNGTEKTITSTTTEIPDDEALTFIGSVIGSDNNKSILLDTLEIDNYVGLA